MQREIKLTPKQIEVLTELAKPGTTAHYMNPLTSGGRAREMKAFLRKCWREDFVESGVYDPETGNPLYCWEKVRPRWYWWMCGLSLFLRILWRPYDAHPETGRALYLDWRTAWEISMRLLR